MKILFAASSWGLGHATRDLILIRALTDAGHSVTVLSTDRALKLLRGELSDRCDYIDFPDIPKSLGHTSASFYIKMTMALPQVFRTFWREHRFVEEMCRPGGFDRVVSDSRYGVWSSSVPSYHLMHTLHQIMPFRARPVEWIIESLQQRILSGARKVLIPDQEENGLAGELCHDLVAFRRDQIEYLGILSSVLKMPVEQDVDYFITVSGVEPQRSVLEGKVLKQARDLDGRVVITLGRPDLPFSLSDDGRLAVYSYLGRRRQAEMMNRARVVVSRSGYTTLMELAELGKRALMVPAVGQSEQEYLADLHERRGTMHSVPQGKLSLARDLVDAERYPGLVGVRPTCEAVEKFLRIVEA